MNYALKSHGDGIHILQVEGVDSVCPIKASFPSSIPVPQEVLAINPKAQPQRIFIGQKCGTSCPLFEIHGNNEIELHCGTGRIIKDVEINEAKAN